jgi:hypothetical protein
MKKTLSRICTCYTCGREELTKRSVLPDKWIITWEHGYTLCDKCTQRFIDRWGVFPDYWITGGGWDEFEFPEDTSHWRQTDFKFV